MSRENWERLVAAVLDREHFRQLCFDHSRSPSISTISSDTTSDFSGQILRFSSNNLEAASASPSASVPLTNSSVSQVRTNADSRPNTRKLFSAWHRRRKPKDKYLVDIPEDLAIHRGRVRRFSLHELQVATENFSNKNIRQYSKFYKGRLADGSPVAVKRCRGNFQTAEFRFQREVEINSIAAHQNVLHVLGFCITKEERLLVYPFMANGSVASRLRDRHESEPPLNWPTRKRIALGTARGLAYLHYECNKKIIHRNIKAANILLDEDFEAVVADFELGVTLEHDATNVEEELCGTIGHIAPEYYSTGKCSEKADVFGYGVFLCELITGQRVFDSDRLRNDEDMMLLVFVKEMVRERKWEKIVDPACGGNYIHLEVEQLTQIALLCTQSSPAERPNMSEVVRILEDGDGLAERWEERLKETYREYIHLIKSDWRISVEDNIFNLSPTVSDTSASGEVVGMLELEDGLPGELSKYETFCREVEKHWSQEEMSCEKVENPFLTEPDTFAEEDLGINWGRVRRFSLHELQVATNNFRDKDIINGYGHNRVYKGRLADGSSVVVKRHKDRGRSQTAEVQFQTELEINSISLHPNVLHMLGFCITSNERLIVYPLLANGSVASCLRGRHESRLPLDWSIRKGIALGTARGLAYLHNKCDPQIIHRDIKATNILLDEVFEAVVGDFELAIIMDYDVTHATTSVVGTFGHIAPEYVCHGICSDKTDVYGYGAFLLELITGQRIFELAGLDWVKRNLKLRKWEMLADPHCGGNQMEEVVEQLTKIALLCTQSTPQRRPKMSEIVKMLEFGDFLSDMWEECSDEEMFS